MAHMATDAVTCMDTASDRIVLGLSVSRFACVPFMRRVDKIGIEA